MFADHARCDSEINWLRDRVKELEERLAGMADRDLDIRKAQAERIRGAQPPPPPGHKNPREGQEDRPGPVPLSARSPGGYRSAKRHDDRQPANLAMTKDPRAQVAIDEGRQP